MYLCFAFTFHVLNLREKNSSRSVGLNKDDSFYYLHRHGASARTRSDVFFLIVELVELVGLWRWLWVKPVCL